MQQIDALIVGQGLAGTTLAWQLLAAGWNIRIVDRGDAETSSRVAAGLITPVTGKRLVLSPTFHQDWQLASNFYRHMEELTETSLLAQTQTVRLFEHPAECSRFARKQPLYGEIVTPLAPDDWPTGLGCERMGGFQMQGGRLQVEQYLRVSRQAFEEREMFLQADFPQDVNLQRSPVSFNLNGTSLRATRVLFCQGYQPQRLPIFQPIRFNPAKGEILDIALHNWNDARIWHRKIWIAPEHNGTFRLGATYDWDDLTPHPTVAGQAELLHDLQRLLPQAPQVLRHRAAVRPTMGDFHPVIGLHPQLPHIGILNGLGSKGSLLAPRMAGLFVEQLLHGTPIPPQFSINRWYT